MSRTRCGFVFLPETAEGRGVEDLVHGLHRHGRPVQLREHKAVLRLQELPPVPQKGLQLRRKICLTMPDSSASWHTALAE